MAGFADAHQLLGSDGKGLEHVGISFSENRVIGNRDKVLLRFDPTYLQMANDKSL